MDEYPQTNQCWAGGDGYLKFKMFDCFNPTPDQFSHLIGPFYKNSVSGFWCWNFSHEFPGGQRSFRVYPEIHPPQIPYIHCPSPSSPHPPPRPPATWPSYKHCTPPLQPSTIAPSTISIKKNSFFPDQIHHHTTYIRPLMHLGVGD